MSNPGTPLAIPVAADPAKKPDGQDNWGKSLAEWAYQLTVLKVVTYVGQAAIKETTPDGIPKQIEFDSGGSAMYTVCDLIGGDITNVIPEAYLNNVDLRDFHAKQVAAAGAVLPNNLKVLGDLLGTILK